MILITSQNLIQLLSLSDIYDYRNKNSPAPMQRSFSFNDNHFARLHCRLFCALADGLCFVSCCFRLFSIVWTYVIPPSIKIEHVRSSLGCPDFFTPCLVRFYAYVKAH